MPKPTPAPAAAPAPAPTPEPIPTPVPPIEPPKPDAFIQKILGDLGQVPEPVVTPAPEPTPVPAVVPPVEPPPVPPVEPPAEPPVEPQPAPTPKKKKVKVLNTDDVLPPPAPIAHTPPPQPAPVQPSADDQYIASLTPEQREELHEMEVAESLYPDQHKGLKKKTIEFYKQFDQRVQQLQTENPGRSLDDNDAEFQRLMSSKPRIGASQARRVQREIGALEAEERVQKRFAPELEELKSRTIENELRPTVDKFQKQVQEDIAEKLILPDTNSPLNEAIKARAEGKVLKKHQMPIKIYEEEAKISADLAGEYVFLIRGGKKFNDKNQTHVNISNFIAEQCRNIANSGPDITLRNGRRFLTREQFYSMLQSDPAEAASLNPDLFETKTYWTVNHGQVLEMFAWRGKRVAEMRLAQTRKLAEEYGYVPGTDEVVTPIAQTPTPPPPPPSTPSGPRRMPAGAVPAAVPQTPDGGGRQSLDAPTTANVLFRRPSV